MRKRSAIAFGALAVLAILILAPAPARAANGGVDDSPAAKGEDAARLSGKLVAAGVGVVSRIFAWSLALLMAGALLAYRDRQRTAISTGHVQ